MNNKKGFTLIELLAVVTILAIIFLFIVPKVADVINNNKIKTYKLSISKVLDIIESDQLNNGTGVTYQLKNSKLTVTDDLSIRTIDYNGDLGDDAIMLLEPLDDGTWKGMAYTDGKCFKISGVNNIEYDKSGGTCNGINIGGDEAHES